MSNMKRSMRRVFWLLALCFFLLLGYLGKLVFVDREEISGNAYNSRLRYVDETIKRGDILDREGEVIATSTRQEDGTYKREYPRGRMAAHITGYSSVGKTGVEAAENFELMKLHNELFQRVSSVVRKTELQGNSVALTMDMDIQTTAGNLLGSAKGAIVVMEPSTGRILALQAYPDFDPNTVEAQWDTLKEDADSPLVNRATQGLYPPGSTFKIVTLASALEKLPPLAGVTGSAVLFALLNQLPQGWLGFEGTHLAALPAAWYKPNLFWLGLPDLTVFSSSDYFPLLPWVFLYWVGYFFARWFRARCTAQPGLPPKALRPLCAVGSRTLLIYMLHQPVIYGALLGLHALGLA